MRQRFHHEQGRIRHRPGGSKKNEALKEFITWALGRPDIDCDACEERSAKFGNDPPCETCPLPGISAENLQAWELYQTINNQFVYDFAALPLVFEVFDIHCTRRQARELLKKLSIIHDLTVKHGKE